MMNGNLKRYNWEVPNIYRIVIPTIKERCNMITMDSTNDDLTSTKINSTDYEEGVVIDSFPFINNKNMDKLIKEYETEKPCKKTRQDVAPPVRNKGGKKW